MTKRKTAAVRTETSALIRPKQILRIRSKKMIKI